MILSGRGEGRFGNHMSHKAALLTALVLAAGTTSCFSCPGEIGRGDVDRPTSTDVHAPAIDRNESTRAYRAVVMATVGVSDVLSIANAAKAISASESSLIGPQGLVEMLPADARIVARAQVSQGPER